MPDTTSLSNRALQRLGAARLTDFLDDTRNGNACQTCYAPLRDALLRKHPWRFAIARATLAADGSPPPGAPNFNYRFAVPADFIRLVREKDPRLDWQLEGRYILTNDAGPLYLKYIYRVTNVNYMDPLYQELLSCDMADAMCEELTQSTSKRAAIAEDRKDLLTEAKKANAFEVIPEEGENGSWIDSRN